MRLVLVGALGPLGAQAEAARVLAAQATALARAGHGVLVAWLSEEAGQAPELAGCASLCFDAEPGSRLVRELREAMFGADLVHLHLTDQVPAGLVESLAHVAPVVLELHDESVTRDPLHQLDLDGAARVCVPSRTLLVRLAERVQLAPELVKLQPIFPCRRFPRRAPAPRAHGGSGPLRVLHFGELSRERGTLDLVACQDHIPAERLELFLAGPASREVAEVLETRLEDRAGLRWEREASDAGLERLAAECHVAAFPSRLSEGYSLAVEEALALGLAVWTSTGEAARERLGPQAVNVLPPEDPGAWAAAFERLQDGTTDDPRSRDSAPLPAPADALRRLEELYRSLLEPGADPRIQRSA